MPEQRVMRPEPITLKGEAMRLVVYGEMGVGKTTLAMSFPRPLVIDTDDGLISVTYAAGGAVDGIRMEPQGYRDVEKIVQFVRDHLDETDTIVIDDISDLCDNLISELTEEHAKADRHAKRPMLMENIPEQIEYLGNQQQIRRLLRALRQTKRHVVVIAGMRIDDKNGDKHVIDVSPKTQRIVGKWASVVGELKAGVVNDELGPGEHRVLFTAPKPTRQAKARFAELRPLVVDPDYEKLWLPIKDKMPEPEQEGE